MPQEQENILRKMLNEVDAIQKLQRMAFVVLGLIMMGLFILLGLVSYKTTADPREITLFGVFVLFFGMVYIAMAQSILHSRMTRRVIKAIELLAQTKAPESQQGPGQTPFAAGQ